MKRPLKLGVCLMFFCYLGLGPFVYPREAAQPVKAELPMASWSVPQIEAQSREALHVVGAPASLSRAGSARFLPDLKPLTPSDIYTVGSRAEGDLRLKFATTIYNAGRGPLETRGARNPRTGALEVYQYVYERRRAEGERAVKGRPVGTFNYNHRHGHLHFDDFARYELWRLDVHGKRIARVADNAKVGFCLMDIKNMTSNETHLESGLIDRPGGPVYAGCRRDIQGISVGWGDEYLALLHEQDLDLTGVPSGSYALVVTSNPQRQLEELSYANNAAVAYVTLEGEKVVWSSEAAAAGG